MDAVFNSSGVLSRQRVESTNLFAYLLGTLDPFSARWFASYVAGIGREPCSILLHSDIGVQTTSFKNICASSIDYLVTWLTDKKILVMAICWPIDNQFHQQIVGAWHAWPKRVLLGPVSGPKVLTRLSTPLIRTFLPCRLVMQVPQFPGYFRLRLPNRSRAEGCDLKLNFSDGQPHNLVLRLAHAELILLV